MPARIDVAMVERALAARAPVLVDRQSDDRAAAVAAILRDRPHGAEVLLIRRAARTGDPWSGHMAFPGGREDPRDTDLLSTAVRETHEEVGLDLARSGQPLGRLDDLPAIARGRRVGMTIAPFVFRLVEERPLVTNEEVEEVLWAELAPLARGEAATSIDYDIEGQRLTLPAFDVGGHVVWGLTYRMLESLFDVLAGSGAISSR